ncbi:hypothetical protein BJX66DRAFT_70233 [Aspergillus keveii]|uniref:Uncharacterized protein n=1 Tax=Aspergillus keveii TaxID=714993 RepID=A0ABR4FP28_9EURO
MTSASNDDIIELLGCVLALISAGFSSSGSPTKSADWALHISGIVSIIDCLDPRAVELAGDVPRLAKEVAVHLDIGAFSLGSASRKKRNGRLAWLEWEIAPPDAPLAQAQACATFSPMEIMTGYPRSLVTIIAALSAVLECRERGEENVDLLLRQTVNSLYKRACACAGTTNHPPAPVLHGVKEGDGHDGNPICSARYHLNRMATPAHPRSSLNPTHSSPNNRLGKHAQSSAYIPVARRFPNQCLYALSSRQGTDGT